MIFKNFFRIFFDYEKEILLQIEKKLSQEARIIFQNRINQINKVCRLWKYKNVNMYYIKNGKSSFDEKSQFPLNLSEVKFAKVKIEYTKNNIKQKTITAIIWLVEGHIFSIHFNISPKILKKGNYKITDVEILCDPMQKIDVTKTIISDDSNVRKWLNQSLKDINIKSIYTPLLPDIQNKKLKELNTFFPKDFIEVIKKCNGFEVDKCIIYGLYDTREIQFNEHELVVIVEGNRAKLLVIDLFLNDGHVYLIDCEYDSVKLIDYGDSFFNALIRYLEN